MKLNYHADTDSLYIELCDRPSVDSREISEGVVLDYDAEGRLVGIDVDNAGNKVELQKILLSKLPGKVASPFCCQHNHVSTRRDRGLADHPLAALTWR